MTTTTPAASAPPIAVTGATGALGRRVAERLVAAGAPVRLLVRDTARAPVVGGGGSVEVAAADYRDTAALTAALAGVRTLFLVSAGESEDRPAVHRGAVDAAVAAGVERIVYTSFLGAAPDAVFLLARHHHDTEQHLAASGLAVTVLRNSLYLDVLPDFADEEGTIRGPAGDGRLAPVSRDDVADAAAAVLLAGADAAAGSSPHDGRTHELTGPEALTLTEVAAVLTGVGGRGVRFVDETLEEARASRAPWGAPGWMVDGWISTYTSIAAGELDVVTGDVELLTGHPATGVAAWLRARAGQDGSGGAAVTR